MGREARTAHLERVTLFTALGGVLPSPPSALTWSLFQCEVRRAAGRQETGDAAEKGPSTAGSDSMFPLASAARPPHAACLPVVPNFSSTPKCSHRLS